jgi:hypothetical protein
VPILVGMVVTYAAFFVSAIPFTLAGVLASQSLASGWAASLAYWVVWAVLRAAVSFALGYWAYSLLGLWLSPTETLAAVLLFCLTLGAAVLYAALLPTSPPLSGTLAAPIVAALGAPALGAVLRIRSETRAGAG